MDNKYIFIKIKVTNGEYQHIEKSIFITRCKNLDFAVLYYLYHLYGYGNRLTPVLNKVEWKVGWWSAPIVGEIVNYTEITRDEYFYLENLFYFIKTNS